MLLQCEVDVCMHTKQLGTGLRNTYLFSTRMVRPAMVGVGVVGVGPGAGAGLVLGAVVH